MGGAIVLAALILGFSIHDGLKLIAKAIQSTALPTPSEGEP